MGEDGMDLDGSSSASREKTSDRNREEESNPNPEETEEGKAIKGQKAIYMPSKDEWDMTPHSDIIAFWPLIALPSSASSGLGLDSSSRFLPLVSSLPPESIPSSPIITSRFPFGLMATGSLKVLGSPMPACENPIPLRSLCIPRTLPISL